MENEIWKPVVGYEGLYEVSSLARVRSVDRQVIGNNGVKRIIKGTMLIQQTNMNGYFCVGLHKNGFRVIRLVHRLLAEAFIPNPNNKPYIDHINRNRKDNSISNLRWCTSQENCNNPNTMEYARTTRYISLVYEKALRTKKERGTKTCEKPVYMYDLDGNFIRGFKSAKEAGRTMGILSSEISSLCAHRGEKGRKTVGGYIWSKEYNEKIDSAQRETTRKKVYQYTPDGTFIREWESVTSASSFYGVGTISRCAKSGKIRLSAGYIWRYYKTDKL